MSIDRECLLGSSCDILAKFEQGDVIMSEDEGRLRWMCRRGMLELDVLFERFIDSGGYTKLNEQERQLFEEMMLEADPVLFNWLLGSEVVEKRFAGLIKKVLGSSQSK